MESVKNILLITNSQEAEHLIEAYVRNESSLQLRLQKTTSLSEGKAHLSHHQADLVILDFALDDEAKFQTFLSLYRDFPDCAFIVLTGEGEDELGKQILKYGISDFLNREALLLELKIDGKSSVLGRIIRHLCKQAYLLGRLNQAQQLAKIGHWEIDVQTNKLSCSGEIYDIFEEGNFDKFNTLEGYIRAIHPDDQEKVVLKFIQAFKDGEDFEVEHKIQLGDGHIKHLIIEGRAEKDLQGNYTSLLGTTQDISGQKAFDQLALEKEQAEQSAKLKQDFLAKTSHEIRTPLNPILLLTNILLNTQPTPQQKEHLNAIKTAGETLLAVVNDVLDLSKIEAGKINFHHNIFKLSEVFAALREMMELNAREKSLDLIFELDAELPTYIIGDNVRLTQILLNLIGNAIKFTHKGYIRVEARRKKRTANRIRIEFYVNDTGIGIPKDKLADIFESFNQVNTNLLPQYKGTGLGLTIVKQLVKLQGGDIFVASEEGQGSTFTFELDFDISEEQSAKSQQTEELSQEKLAGLEVLLVEDNPLNQLVTKKIVTAWGANIDIANNGKECLKVLSHKTYDVILMDLQMPEMDGYEATRVIRSQMTPPIQHIPIIALTANAFTGMDAECLKVGMNDYVSKPFEPGYLYNKIVKYAPSSSTHKNRTEPLQALNTELNGSNGMKKKENTLPEISMNIPASMGRPPFVDLSYLRGISMGDNTIVRKAIDRYLKDTPDLLTQMEDSLKDRNYDQLGKYAHKLKSSVGIMGMDNMKDTMERIVALCKNDMAREQLHQIIASSKLVIQQSIKELEEELRNM